MSLKESQRLHASEALIHEGPGITHLPVNESRPIASLEYPIGRSKPGKSWCK